MTSFLKQTIQRIFSITGYKFSRIAAAAPPVLGVDCFLSLLKQHGFQPQHIIDVGANHGDWTRAAIKYFPESYYTLIEPQEQLKAFSEDLLQSPKIQWLRAGVADKTGALMFTVCSRDDSSSFLPDKEQAQREGYEQILVPVTTLNEIVKNGLPFPSLVKIDAEGYDLKVLNGASELFGKTDVFIVETAVFSPGQENTAANVIKKMESEGYRLFDIVEINRSPKYRVLWLCDLAFLKKDSKLFEKATSYQ